jgi:hypothetical protein
MLVPTECGENAGSFCLGSPADKIFGYAASLHHPAMGLTRDSRRVHRASTMPLPLGTPEGVARRWAHLALLDGSS